METSAPGCGVQRPDARASSAPCWRSCWSWPWSPRSCSHSRSRCDDDAPEGPGRGRQRRLAVRPADGQGRRHRLRQVHQGDQPAADHQGEDQEHRRPSTSMKQSYETAKVKGTGKVLLTGRGRLRTPTRPPCWWCTTRRQHDPGRHRAPLPLVGGHGQGRRALARRRLQPGELTWPTPSPTWYDVLGVERDATPEQIKAAWRNATDKFEPGSGSGQFRMFNEAADVLLDPVAARGVRRVARRRPHRRPGGRRTGGRGTEPPRADAAPADARPRPRPTRRRAPPVRRSRPGLPSRPRCSRAGPARRHRGWPWSLTVLLALLTIVALVVVGVFGLKVRSDDAVADARDAGARALPSGPPRRCSPTTTAPSRPTGSAPAAT